LAIIAHGHAAIIDAADPDFAELDATQVECGKQSVREWQGTGVYLHFQPANLFTVARVKG
jgi:hypothetical protein